MIDKAAELLRSKESPKTGVGADSCRISSTPSALDSLLVGILAEVKRMSASSVHRVEILDTVNIPFQPSASTNLVRAS